MVEAMGGVEPAFTFARDAILAGKHFATSNKALIAKHGAELIALAKERNLNCLFEASVGGGIPIIRPLNSCLTADVIEEISGILNGTTNYMMTEMSEMGSEFDDVLKDAQQKGYAEADPTADIEGYDACRKIAILTSWRLGSRWILRISTPRALPGLQPQILSMQRRWAGGSSCLAAVIEPETATAQWWRPTC